MMTTLRFDLGFIVKLTVLLWACSAAPVLADDRDAPTKGKKSQVSEPKPQTPKGKKKRPQKRGQKPPVSTQTQLADTAKPKPEPEHPVPSTPPKAAAAVAAIADDSEVRTEGDKSVKTMEFSGLDIEGQLKTPQMLIFLNRLRAEFDRPRLPHRSFLPELARSREHKEL
jgi:hypothetical protein